MSFVIFIDWKKHSEFHKHVQVQVDTTQADIARIAVVLPIGDENYKAEYLHKMTESVSNFYKRNWDKTNDFHFSIIDSKGVYGPELVKKINNQIDQGVQYFVITESRVSEQLAGHYDTTLNKTTNTEYINGSKYQNRIKTSDGNLIYSGMPVIIFTSAASTNLKLEKDKLYRYYVTTLDEVRAIRNDNNFKKRTSSIDKKGIDNNENSVLIINGEEEYGRSFREDYAHDAKLPVSLNPLNYLTIESGSPYKDIKSDVFDQITEFRVQFDKFPRVILIAHFGENLKHISKAIYEFYYTGKSDDLKPALFYTSPLAIDSMRQYIADSLKIFDSHIAHCVADISFSNNAQNAKENKEIESFINSDIEVGLTYVTIMRLVKILEQIKVKPNTTFHDEWVKLDYPNFIREGTDSKNESDVRVGVRMDYLRDKKHNLLFEK